MHIYKPGDKVRILKAVGCKGYDLSDEYTVGDICEVEWGTDEVGDTKVYTKDKSGYSYFAQDAIEPAVKTLDALQVGDELETSTTPKTVLEVGASGKTFLLSLTGRPTEADAWFHIEEIKELGWKIKGAESESSATLDVVEQDGEPQRLVTVQVGQESLSVSWIVAASLRDALASALERES